MVAIISTDVVKWRISKRREKTVDNIGRKISRPFSFTKQANSTHFIPP